MMFTLPLLYEGYIDCSRLTFRDFLEVISKQATKNGNAVCVDNWNKERTKEIYYPYRFEINGKSFYWSISRTHTRGRHLCTHYELWGHGLKTGNYRFATGVLTRGKLFKFFRAIYEECKNPHL